MLMQKMNLIAIMAKTKINKFFTEEKGAVDIVAIVVLIGIAVILAGVFKNQISNLIQTLLGKITNSASNIVEV